MRYAYPFLLLLVTLLACQPDDPQPELPPDPIDSVPSDDGLVYFQALSVVSSSDCDANVSYEEVAATDFENNPPDKYNPPQHGADGDLDTRWSARANASIFFNFGEEKRITGLRIAFLKSDERRSQYRIYLKQNRQAVNYHTLSAPVWSTILLAGTYEYIDIPDTSVQFIAIRGYGNENSDWFSINDVQFIGQEVNLNDWKLTFPVCDATGTVGSCSPYEVTAPEFPNWACGDQIPSPLLPYFYWNAAGYYSFYTTYTGVTTPNAIYSRTELREMQYGVDEEYNWTLETGGEMNARIRIRDLEGGAEKAIVLQIHGFAPNSKPLLKIIWEDGRLRALRKVYDPDDSDGDGKLWEDEAAPEILAPLQADGATDWIDVQIIANLNELTIYVDGVLMKKWTEDLTLGWGISNTYYFKAGNYMQHQDSGSGMTVDLAKAQVMH